MTPDEEVKAPAASRPAPMEEVRPQGRDGRHCGSGYELVLDATVPQMERDVVEEWPLLMTGRLFGMVCGGGQAIAPEGLPRVVRRRGIQGQIVLVPDLPQPSSSSGGKRRKKRKRRKKKTPKTHSSSHFLQGKKAVTEYSGRDGTAPGVEEGNKLIEKKVIAGDIWEDIFHKYSDPKHLYISPSGICSPSGKCWLDGRENRRRYVRRLGYAPEWTGMLLTASNGQVCYEERIEQTRSTETVKDEMWVFFDVPPTFEFLLRRANAVADASTECFNLGTEASMMTMRVWVMMTKLQRRHRRWRSRENGAFCAIF